MYIFIRCIDRIIYKILSFLVSTSIVILLILVTFKVISRYFNVQFIAPPDEIITLVYVWMLFISSALLVRNRKHIRIDIFENYLQNHLFIRKIYDIFICILILIFLIILIKSSLVLYEQSGNRSSPMLQLPQRLWYLPFLISNILMIFYIFLQIGEHIFELFKPN